MKVRLTRISSNRKTGPIPVSTTHHDSCPPSCPMQGGGCYAKSGRTRLAWNGVDKYGLEWSDFCSEIEKLPRGQVWRHNQAGDLPGVGDSIDSEMLTQLVKANHNRRGFTYTHCPVLKGKHAKNNRTAITEANKHGFTISLSANNLQHADEPADLGIAPVVVVLPEDATQKFVTPAGRRGIVCPAAIDETHQKNCANCQLCATQRSIIVGFPAHGNGKKKAGAIAKGYNT